MKKTISKKSVIASFVAIMASVVFLFGATRISAAKAQETVTPVASWTLKAEGTDYTATQHTMMEVCGISGSALQTDAMLWRQDTSASPDTSTNLIYSPSIALTAAGAHFAVHFAQNADKKIGKDINTVVVKLYAHLTADGSAYSTANGGIRLYAPDDTGENNSGYIIPGDIVQDQWVDLVISGEDLVKLSDSNGCFSGFTAGNATVSNLRFNNGWQYTDDFSWIAFDSFTGYVEYYVTFDDGVNKTSQLIAADTPITAPAVEKEGYSLLGWYDESGKKVDLTAGVKKSCTLTAKWQPTGGALEAKSGGVYGYSDASNANRKVKEICGAELTVQDMMFWSSATDVNRADAPAGYPIYSVSTNHVGASPTITFANQGISLKNADGSWKGIVVRVYAHLTTDKSAYYTENGGIRLYGADDDGTNKSGYMLPADIVQDEWVYLEIPGEYLADQNGDFSGFAVGSNVNGGASGEEGKKMYAGGNWLADGSYVLFDTFTVGSYIVTFRNGDEGITQLVSADTPITAPAVEKEGYTLLGWYDENGEKVDLTAGVKKSCTLTAKWQPADGTLKAADGSGYNDASQTNRKVKEICGAALTVQDMMFWSSATDDIGKGAPSGYPIYSVSTNHVGASPTITFGGPVLSLRNADGSWKGIVVRIYAHLTTDQSAYYTENGGIRLYGADDDGKNNSGYMLPADIVQDEWVYLEIPGEYLGDRNGDFSGFAVGSNVNGGASGEEGKKMYAGGSWAAEGSYVLFDTFTVGSYIVTFRDGNNATQQLIAENGRAVAPEASGKAYNENHHYTFDGWYNGEQKWNFEDAVTASMTLECRYVGEAHVYGEGVITPPTQTEKGYTTYTCTCGYSYRGDETDVLPADETLVSIYGTSLSVEDKIGLNIYVNKLTAKEVYMLVTTSNGEERVACRDIKSGYYRYTIYLPAQDYAKEVAFRFVDEDGSQSKTYRYSIKAYAEQAKHNPSVDENTKAVIDAMEDYATLAKAYFNNEEIAVPETVKNVENTVFDTYTIATEGALPEGVSVKGITLIFNAEITLRLYCVFGESVNAGDIAITVGGATAEWQEKTIDGVRYRYVDFSGIAAADLDSVIVFNIGDYTVSCSALSYANVILKNGTQNETLINMLKALYLYHNACKTCFAK